jgi:hypothetical protein
MALSMLSCEFKGRFAISINVICVGIRSGLPKRRYRVVIDYVGERERARTSSATAARKDAGCFVDYGACANFGKTSSCLWDFVVFASDRTRSSPDGSKIVLKLGSQVSSGVVETETGVWTADKQPVALLAKK